MHCLEGVSHWVDTESRGLVARRTDVLSPVVMVLKTQPQHLATHQGNTVQMHQEVCRWPLESRAMTGRPDWRLLVKEITAKIHLVAAWMNGIPIKESKTKGTSKSMHTSYVPLPLVHALEKVVSYESYGIIPFFWPWRLVSWFHWLLTIYIYIYDLELSYYQ